MSFIILLLFCFLGSSCKVYYSDAVNFQNNSNDTLSVAYSPSSDTTLPTDPGTVTALIFPRTQGSVAYPINAFPQYPHGTIKIFVFKQSDLGKHSWDSISVLHLLLRRYDLTFDSLKKINNTIAYP